MQKRILTQSTKQKNHKHIKNKDKSTSNNSNRCKSLDKSRSTQINETEDTVKSENKSMYISSASLSDKSTKNRKTQINIR